MSGKRYAEKYRIDAVLKVSWISDMAAVIPRQVDQSEPDLQLMPAPSTELFFCTSPCITFIDHQTPSAEAPCRG